MDTFPAVYHVWSDRVAMDLALVLEGSGEVMADILTRHRITAADMLSYSKDTIFLKKVEHLRDEIRERGLTFRLKARAQAEELLETSWNMIHSADVSPSVKADLIKHTVKWGGLEPTKDAVLSEGGGGGVRILINLGGQNVAGLAVESPDVSRGA